MNNKKNKVYIAGFGCISNAGDGSEQTRKGLYADAPSPHRASERVGTTLNVPVFELDSFTETSTSRSMALLEHALKEALEMAGITPEQLKKYTVGVCIGTTVAVQLNDLDFYRKQKSRNVDFLEPLGQYLANNPSRKINGDYGLTGPAITISNACASGADAIAAGALWIETGMCDIVIAGGTDELSRIPLAGFHALGVTSDQPCAPFDAERKGLNLGEGAGAVILVSEKLSSEIRIPEPRFYLAGCGTAGDAYHITSPHPEGRGLERAVNMALARAGIQAEDVAFINAHGTGTLNNDACEAAVYQRIFGDGVSYLSTKGQTGHTLGAAGTLEFIFTLLMLQEGKLPPSTGFRTKAADVPVPPISKQTEIRGAFAMSSSLAFGGCNTVLIAGMEAEPIYIAGTAIFNKIAPAKLSRFKKEHQLRRIDSYTAAIAMAALKAAEDSCFAGKLPEDTGIIITSLNGPQKTTAQFLDELLDYPEDQLLSSSFTHSVHNAAASCVAELLQITGPAFTLAGIPQEPFPRSLFRACIQSGYCSRMIVVYAEEEGYITENLRKTGANLDERVFALLVTKHGNENRLGLYDNFSFLRL